MLDVSDKEEDIAALHPPNGSLKKADMGIEPVPISTLADDLGAGSWLVLLNINQIYMLFDKSDNSNTHLPRIKLKT